MRHFWGIFGHILAIIIKALFVVITMFLVKVKSILMVVGYTFKGGCSQEPDLVSQSGSKQNCHFKIPYISFFLPKIYLLYGINFEILAKGWICFWKSISFPLRFFWLFSRELLFFGNILLLFVPQQPPRHIVLRCFLLNRHCWFFSPIVQI